MYASSAWSSASTPTDAVTPGGHDSGQGGVDDRERRPEVLVRDAGLRPEAREVDDRDRRDLGSRAARSSAAATNGSSGPGTCLPRPIGGVDVVEQLALVRREERAELRRVERRAAADPDEAVEAVARRLDGLAHGALARLAGDAVVDDRLDAGRAERRLEALAETRPGHERVADDERPGDAEPAQVLAGLVRRPGAEDDARARRT